MNKIAYTLKKKQDTEELHLFKVTQVDPKTCHVPDDSICGMMKKTESADNRFICKDEAAARLRCSNIGRHVCGECVRHLYGHFEPPSTT